MKLPGHIAVCAVVTAALLAVPFMFTDGFKQLINGTDAVSSASVTIDAPSGEYTVIINRDRHKSAGDLEVWHDFFSGGDFSIIYDDVECVTLSGDGGALTMAQSFMSRLPENQMRVKTEDAVLAVSKADHGRFDVMIVSAEAENAYGIYSVYGSGNVDVIHIGSGGNTV